jgi:hypothetical protein
MRRIRFTNIVWDTDGEELDLPTETTLAVESDADLADLADVLSDEYGWCVMSFDHEQIDW